MEVEAEGSLLVADFSLSAVFRVDPVTGQRSVLSHIYPGLFVPIDIDPDNFPNIIDLDSTDTVRVAILGTTTFDATTVDPKTVTLAGGRPEQSELKDVNGDGFVDLELEVRIGELDLDVRDIDAILLGETFEVTPIRGADPVELIQ
jgi:hypothetical protein